MSEAIERINEIFSIIDDGICDGYESFRYEVFFGHGLIDTELMVEQEGTQTTNARTQMDDTRLYDLVDSLRKHGEERGENWISFVISYRRGGKVSAKFQHAEN
jgi:hypothetical protein